jgi:hypothetical protein
MAKKAAGFMKQLADRIKLILVLICFASVAVFLSSLGFHKTDSSSGGKTMTTWDWEWAEKTADFFGTTPITLSVFSFIAIVVSLGLAIFIHLKFSPEEELFGSMPEIDPNGPKQTKQKQTPQNPTGSPIFKFAAWFLAILFVFAVGLTLWRDVIVLLL